MPARQTLFLPVSTIEGIHKGGATLRTFEIEVRWQMQGWWSVQHGAGGYRATFFTFSLTTACDRGEEEAHSEHDWPGARAR